MKIIFGLEIATWIEALAVEAEKRPTEKSRAAWPNRNMVFADNGYTRIGPDRPHCSARAGHSKRLRSLRLDPRRRVLFDYFGVMEAVFPSLGRKLLSKGRWRSPAALATLILFSDCSVPAIAQTVLREIIVTPPKQKPAAPKRKIVANCKPKPAPAAEPAPAPDLVAET